MPMMKTVRAPRWALIAAALAAPWALAAAAPARQPVLPVGTCVNMGNSLEAPSETAWGGVPLSSADFTAIRAAGFATVRIPVNWSRHAGPGPDFAIAPEWLARVTQVVNEALATGLNVIIDSHDFNQLHSDPVAATPELAALWDQIGRHFARYPRARLWFELDNEPHDQLTNARLGAALGPALAAVRRSNPDRPVIIGGEFWSGIDSLGTLDLPADAQVYPTFHYYEPFTFTHQGASWVTPTPPPGRHYGLPEDARRLRDDAAKVDRFIARTGRTPFIGESGAIDLPPVEERAAYLAAVRHGFGGRIGGLCVWAYTNTFPIRDRASGQWLPGMLEALGLK